MPVNRESHDEIVRVERSESGISLSREQKQQTNKQVNTCIHCDGMSIVCREDYL